MYAFPGNRRRFALVFRPSGDRFKEVHRRNMLLPLPRVWLASSVLLCLTVSLRIHKLEPHVIEIWIKVSTKLISIHIGTRNHYIILNVE